MLNLCTIVMIDVQNVHGLFWCKHKFMHEKTKSFARLVFKRFSTHSHKDMWQIAAQTELRLKVKHNLNSSMDFTEVHVSLMGFFHGFVKLHFFSSFVSKTVSMCICAVAWRKREPFDSADVCLFVCSNRSALFLFCFVSSSQFTNSFLRFHESKTECNVMTQIHVVQKHSQLVERKEVMNNK